MTKIPEELTIMRNETIIEPLDCTSPPALDLCIRREKMEECRSPCSDGTYQETTTISPDTCTLADSTRHHEITSQNLYYRHESDSSEETSSMHSDKTNDFGTYPMLASFTPVTPKMKQTRPFKAYPKDPFFMAITTSPADALLGNESAEAYADFRKKMLSQVRANHPLPGVTNTKMRRTNITASSQDSTKDASYWEKRRKNNEAAKRSRDARRAKEDEIAIRAAFLEQENLKLKYEIAALRNETTKLRCLLYN